MYAFLLIYIINTYTCSSFKINRSKSDTRRNSTWSPSTPKPPLGRTGWRTYLSWVWRGLGSGSRVCRAGAPLIPTPPCSTLCLTQGPRLSIYWLTEGQTRWAGHTVMFDITYNLFGILIFCDDKNKKAYGGMVRTLWDIYVDESTGYLKKPQSLF